MNTLRLIFKIEFDIEVWTYSDNLKLLPSESEDSDQVKLEIKLKTRKQVNFR